ncbi:MAG: FAD-binding protein [Oscillospiraceae bacterium]|nr:FAD-binding protein [Oscillospiraceae bacterium]
MNFKNYDIIIAGSGVAGLYAALNLAPRFRVLVLAKRGLTVCNSAMAQGGVAAVMDTENDSFELHISDTLAAGGYENNLPNLRVLVEQGPRDVENLQKLGINFDKTDDGNVALALEGGHSRNRVAYHRDSTGQEIVSVLIERVKTLPNVTLLENAHLLDLKKENESFFAELLIEDERRCYRARTVVLATGGIGRVYDYTTNSPTSTGDGIYFAHKMGAKIKDLSYIQFHPTAFAEPRTSAGTNRECFLISETVRGEGAYLLNCKKERFMQKYEPERMELAPRDVVSKCILTEQERTGSDEFFLDVSHIDGEYIKDRFPVISARVRESGFDITKEPVPIYPCQHYLMGGIETDDCGRTAIAGLYAAGECSYTGVHGSNRLASNSLLEALVFSRRVAEDINQNSGTAAFGAQEVPRPAYVSDGKQKPNGLRREIRGIMQKAYFIVPNYEEIKKGFTRITEIRETLENGDYALTPELVEVRSLALVAYIILDELNRLPPG